MPVQVDAIPAVSSSHTPTCMLEASQSPQTVLTTSVSLKAFHMSKMVFHTEKFIFCYRLWTVTYLSLGLMPLF